MRKLFTGTVVLFSFQALACGGRVDIADVEREDAELAEGEENGTEALSTPTAQSTEQPTPSSPTTLGPSSSSGSGLASDTQTAPSPIYDQTTALEECFPTGDATLIDPGPQGGLVVFPTPEAGCTFDVDGTDNACTATWTCCGDVYTVDYSRLPYEDYSFSWPSRIGTGMGRAANEPGEACPLFDAGAAAIAADGFGYSPAWYLAVQEVYELPAGEMLLDPLPLDCELVPSVGDRCGATMVCPEHDYYAAFDEDGELVCRRDAEMYSPAAPGATFNGNGNSCFAHTLPADACFGPGWSKYFQLAQEPK